MVLAIYIAAGLVSGVLLYALGTQRWYWHVMAALAALVIGLLPPLDGSAGEGYYVVTGALFLLLFVWGAGAPFVRVFRWPIRRKQTGRDGLAAA